MGSFGPLARVEYRIPALGLATRRPVGLVVDLGERRRDDPSDEHPIQGSVWESLPRQTISRQLQSRWHLRDENGWYTDNKLDSQSAICPRDGQLDPVGVFYFYIPVDITYPNMYNTVRFYPSGWILG